MNLLIGRGQRSRAHLAAQLARLAASTSIPTLLEAPAPPRADIGEAAFQQCICDLATVFGWTFYHTFDSRKSEPGFPDLVLVRETRVIFAEIKTMRGRLTREQAEWGAVLTRAGADYRLWRPASWGEIVTTLTGQEQR